jgi:iron complex outermembrane receptor protein
MSSLLYTNLSSGRGETGRYFCNTFDAIERVEILRDGASAQYGSDALGVMNHPEENTKIMSVALRSGITSEGDGNDRCSVNNGSAAGEDL